MPGIYIHIPFCVKKCDYCDFISFPGIAGERAKPYFKALKREMEHYSSAMRDKKFDTVFIGGGTPSVIEPALISDMLNELRGEFDISCDAEISIEANPKTLSFEKLHIYRESGINRLSLGVQSADDNVLASIGRIHTFRDAQDSFALARDCGFDNINIDLMYALPGQTLNSYFETLCEAADMAPEHISNYSLIVEEGTPLCVKRDKGAVTLPDDDAAYDMHRLGIKLLKERGYRRYEISNYAKSDRECRHNLNYWNNGEYLGLGAAAHSAIRYSALERWSNTTDIDQYIDSPEFAAKPHDIISREDEIFEYMMVSLRKTEGFSLADFNFRFNQAFEEKYAVQIDALKKRGWLIIDSGRVYLTDEGLDMQNEALIALW